MVAYPDDERLFIEEALDRYFPQPDDFAGPVFEAMRYSLFAGGKRFRPVLVLLSGQLFGAARDYLAPTACAVEFIHTYSLIHDDLPAIDDDDLRRGKPTCHVKFGEATAILAGDGLFAEAFRLILEKQAYDRAETLLAVLKELSVAVGVHGMLGGQVADVMASGEKVEAEVLDYIHAHKTGRLIEACAVSGALLGGAPADGVEKVREYARNLGFAFQIVDDILDEIGDAETLGKPVHSDSAKEKATFPSLYGVEQSKQKAREFTDRAKAAIGRLGGDASRLTALADFVVERSQ